MPTTSREQTQSHSYRNAAERIEDAETLPVGPALKCGACGAETIRDWESTEQEGQKTKAFTYYSQKSPLEAPRACTPNRRIPTGIFRRCKVDGSHLHEHCKVCGHRWLTAFAGAT